jgi:hypothetical protein
MNRRRLWSGMVRAPCSAPHGLQGASRPSRRDHSGGGEQDEARRLRGRFRSGHQGLEVPTCRRSRADTPRKVTRVRAVAPPARIHADSATAMPMAVDIRSEAAVVRPSARPKVRWIIVGIMRSRKWVPMGACGRQALESEEVDVLSCRWRCILIVLPWRIKVVHPQRTHPWL